MAAKEFNSSIAGAQATSTNTANTELQRTQAQANAAKRDKAAKDAAGQQDKISRELRKETEKGQEDSETRLAKAFKKRHPNARFGMAYFGPLLTLRFNFLEARSNNPVVDPETMTHG